MNTRAAKRDKHALWLKVRQEQEAQLAGTALIERIARQNAPGRAATTTLHQQPTRRKSPQAGQRRPASQPKNRHTTRISRRRPERSAIDRIYNQRVKIFLALHQNLFCWCCIARKLRARRSTNVHHKHGRGWRGELQLIEELWVPCCSECHPAWIDSHRDEARKIGMLAPRGQWNRRPFEWEWRPPQ